MPGGFWNDQLGPATPRPALDGSVAADVCIVGGGYTGLWTAWALVTARPSLRVVVVEARHVGFGASGRNGGWLSGLLPGDRERLARGPGGRDGVIALQRSLIDAVGSVLKVCANEGIDADAQLGGTLAVATTAAELTRLRAEAGEDRSWGMGPEDQFEIGPAATAQRVAVAGVRGALYSPHCARIQPAKLVRGLADAVERRGVVIYESTRALTAEAGRVTTTGGDVRAPWVVRATEGFTAALPGLRRQILPMNSSMIVTQPLSPAAWDRIGWAGAETLRDGAHVYAYLQRTADGRVAIGGRGVPYRFGSRTDADGETAAATALALRETLRRLLPGIGPVEVARAWSGVLGVARDWCPTVTAVPSGPGGLAWAGGYVGDGVTTSHLAGRTLADLVLGESTDRTRFPWVGHRSRGWEPEPLRWLGVRSVYGLYRAADRVERRRPDDPRPSAWARLADVIAGRH